MIAWIKVWSRRPVPAVPAMPPRPLETLSDADLQQRTLSISSDREACVTEALFRTRDRFLLAQQTTNDFTERIKTLTVWLVFLTVANGAMTIVQARAAWNALTPTAVRVWVLWERVAAFREGYAAPRDAFTAKAECENQRTKAATEADTRAKEVRAPGAPPPPPLVYFCLPDTVDPRGPKGK